MPGQNITFKAGNQIILEPGFNIQLGSVFNAIIEDCNSNSLAIGNIDVPFIPNVFTPNGDGVNDNYCINVTGANQYHIQIFDRWGVLRYDYLDFIYNSFVCMWDGRCNQNYPNCSSSGILPNDTYFYIITLYNCSNSVEYAGALNIFGVRSYMPIDSISKENSLVLIIPNPNNGSFQVRIENNKKIQEYVIFDIRGAKIIEKKNVGLSLIDIDISEYTKGIYYIKMLDYENNILVEKVINQ